MNDRATSAGRVRARAVVRGRVQGVSYRYATMSQAERLGVTGWVRNLPDGSVELVAEGPREEVEKLLAWCRRGPSFARVDDVDVEWEEATGEFARFGIAR
jgi:acylphosphatase